jgi:hypothetical protein
MKSFGIPDAPANEQALVDLLQANLADLQPVAQALVGSLQHAIEQNAADLGKVNKTLQKSLAGSAASNTKALGPVAQALQSDLRGTIQSNQIAFSQAALPASPTSYSVWCQPGAGPDGISAAAVFGFTEALPTGFAIIGGPFDTAEQAQAFAVSANTAGVCGPVVTVSPLPIPISTNGPPPPCQPVCQPVCPPPIINVTCPPTSVTTGPPLPPPPPPPPPPEPVVEPVEEPLPLPGDLVLQPIAECGLTSTGGLPPVGSPEFCACLDQVRAWIANVGLQARHWLFGPAPGEENGSVTFLDTIAVAMMPLDDALFVGALKLGTRAKEVIDTVKPFLAQVSKVLLDSPTCNPAEQLGIQLALTMVRLLRKLRIGWTLGVQVTIDIDVFLPQLETTLEYVANYICPTEIPSPEVVLECMLRGTVGEAYGSCLLAMRGVDLRVWAPVLEARRERLTPPEYIQFQRRLGNDDESIAAGLITNNSMRGQDAGAAVVLYDQLPTISDHLHWLQRNVFDQAYVEEFQLMDGFDDKFWPTFGHDLRSLGMRKEYAALHYASHWVNPSPGQLREMVFRLREGRVDEDLQFTPEQYEKVLAEQDVGPFFRPRFREILYNVPALSYIRDMHRLNKISDDALREYHQDLGYSLQDSERFVEVDRLRKRRMRTTESHGWNPPAIAKAFAVGQLSEAAARQLMGDLGWTEAETSDMLDRGRAELQHQVLVRSISRLITSTLSQVRSAQLAGVLSVEDATAAIMSLGFPLAQARGVATSTDASARVALVRHATTRLRSAWLHGEITLDQARASLASVGVTDAAIGYMLPEWQVARTPNRKRRTALQYMQDWIDESLPEAEARARLQNLGYESSDIDLFFKAARKKKDAALTREIKAASKASKPAPQTRPAGGTIGG